MPSKVSIREAGPRDGFQNEPETIPTAQKVELIDALARTGIPRLEVTAFVRAEVIPQLADAEEVLTSVEIPAGERLGADPQRARAERAPLRERRGG
jgi:hydroxymethylglutaryl-CoA lyase